MGTEKIAILHYTAPPVIGGVEAVIKAHAQLLTEAHYQVTIMSGRGEKIALPKGTNLIQIPEVGSQFPEIMTMNAQLEKGEVPKNFNTMVTHITSTLAPILKTFNHLIVHNIFTKHFNLPLTAALHQLLDNKTIAHCIAWCHDFTWSSPHSKSKVHPGYPWELLRTYREDVTYVTVSERRKRTLIQLLGCQGENIETIHNGVDPVTLLGLSEQGHMLISRMGLLDADLILLMPVRVTQAKNVEYTLQVTAALKSQNCQVKLILTGPPDPHDEKSMAYFESLKALRKQLQLDNNMHFVFESGPDPKQPYTINARVVGDLFRVSDVMFMPSHREGFGMPVLEAGLVGIPIICTNMPAAEEIGKGNVLTFNTQDDPNVVATRIIKLLNASPVHSLRQKVRKNYTWQAIFNQKIYPLLEERESAS